jgi:hypothetical protein
MHHDIDCSMALGPLIAAVLLGAVFDRDAALALLRQRATENRNAFYVYRNADSAFNHGFSSGLFGTLDAIALDATCIDDSDSVTGCRADRNRLDRTRGNVLQISFAPLGPGEFAGVNFEEPENWTVRRTGTGYDLRGATAIRFEVRSPTAGGISLQFGAGGSTTAPFHVPFSRTFTTVTIPLQSLTPALSSLEDVHILFTVVANTANAPNGGTLLLDDIEFIPVPAAHATALGFPLANESFGVVPAGTVQPGRVPIPIDQLIRNVSPIYESALVLEALLDSGRPADLAAARIVADALDYALRNDNRGLPLPVSPDGATGLHSAYTAGDLALHNDQGPGGGRAGEVRLAGFSASPLCNPSGSAWCSTARPAGTRPLRCSLSCVRGGRLPSRATSTRRGSSAAGSRTT